MLLPLSTGILVVSILNVRLPPSGTRPPPVRPVPVLIVVDELASMGLLTPLVAMLNVPLVVIGPPVSPGPLPTLVTVPMPGKLCPVAKVIWPLLAMFNPVSVGVAPLAPNNRSSLPDGELVLLPTGSASHWKS